jgi:DNA invertase Pin-like site-specific DNA recombinase
MKEKKLTMSTKELKRITVLEKLIEKEITVNQGAEVLGLSQRQVYRIKKRYKHSGAEGLIHRSRGKPSNRGFPKELKKEVLTLYRKHYWDFGPTLFSEKLSELHKINIDHETLRRWLRESGEITSIRKSRGHRKKRQRRSSIGEMLQFDGSPHDWFEGRGEVCSLLHGVDDASGKVYLRFAKSENTEDVLRALRQYVETNGIPHSIYTDRHSVYYAEEKKTDFQKAMDKLSVRCIYANSPQAKGRVERGNRTLQDRLVKEMRLRGISDIDSANKFLKEEFIADYNNKFAHPENLPDIHIKNHGKNLDNVFCNETNRQVRNDYTITLNGQYIQLEKSEVTLPLPKTYVTLRKYLDGSFHIFYEEEELKYTILPKKPKRKNKPNRKPSSEHPWRKIKIGKAKYEK